MTSIMPNSAEERSDEVYGLGKQTGGSGESAGCHFLILL